MSEGGGKENYLGLPADVDDPDDLVGEKRYGSRMKREMLDRLDARKRRREIATSPAGDAAFVFSPPDPHAPPRPPTPPPPPPTPPPGQLPSPESGSKARERLREIAKSVE